jgi:hypothetical protein
LHGLKPGLPVARLGRIVLELVPGYVKKSTGVMFRAKKGCLIAYGLKRLASALPLAGGSGATYSLIMFTAGAFFCPADGSTGPVGFPNAGSRVLHASVLYLPVVSEP